MIAVDTNVIVRLLAQDNQPQFRKSLQLFQEQEIFIPDTVILETEWVLRFAYQFQPVQVCQALRNLFGLPNVRLSDASKMVQVLQWHEDGLDFADAFHLLQSQQCSAFYTFNDKFLKKAQGLTQSEVRKPSRRSPSNCVLRKSRSSQLIQT